MKPSIIALLISLSLFWACKSQETLPADQVALRQNESARVNSVTVQVDTLQQSGCGRCIIAYNVFVSALVSTATAQQRVRLFLYTPGSRRDSTGVVLAGQTYKVILRDLIPHTDDNSGYGSTRPADNKAIIQVTKL